MELEIITRQDLIAFRQDLLNDIRELLGQNNASVQKQWLKGAEVRKILNVSPNTLQSLRVHGLKWKKVGGTIYYSYSDIQKLMS